MLDKRMGHHFTCLRLLEYGLSQAAHPMKILVVEDTLSSQLLICEILSQHGHAPVPCQNGAEALARFDAEKPDLVLLDVILPDTDGFSVAQHLRQRESQADWTPIIFLTMLDNDADMARGIAAGGDDYLFKPVSEVVLIAKIRAMQRIIQMRTSLVVLARRLDAANRELRRLSSVDGLTGIANRRQFDESMDREWRRTQRTGSELGLLLCDVDHFKLFNDRYGHQAGDDCLRLVARCIATTLDRGGDLAARYGGEEFAVILPDTSLGGSIFVAERLRQSVAQLKIPHPDSSHGSVTLSIGVAAASANRQMPYQTLIRQADQALYRAKDAGRNRVQHETVPLHQT